MESDVPEAFSKAHEMIDSLKPLCEKHDKPFKRLSKAETGWLLDTIMIYIRMDTKASEIIELDNRIIESLQEANNVLRHRNDKLNQQLTEMRYYA